jgi:hypothetical protein
VRCEQSQLCQHVFKLWACPRAPINARANDGIPILSPAMNAVWPMLGQLLFGVRRYNSLEAESVAILQHPQRCEKRERKKQGWT